MNDEIIHSFIQHFDVAVRRSDYTILLNNSSRNEWFKLTLLNPGFIFLE